MSDEPEIDSFASLWRHVRGDRAMMARLVFLILFCLAAVCGAVAMAVLLA